MRELLSKAATISAAEPGSGRFSQVAVPFSTIWVSARSSSVRPQAIRPAGRDRSCGL